MHLTKHKITLTVSTAAVVNGFSTVFNGLVHSVLMEPVTGSCESSTKVIDLTNEQSTDWRIMKFAWSTSPHVYYPVAVTHGSTADLHSSTYMGAKLPLCNERIRARVLQGTTVHSVYLTFYVEGA